MTGVWCIKFDADCGVRSDHVLFTSRRTHLDFGGTAHDNVSMKNHGTVHNGTIVIDGGVPLPEGTRVAVSIEPVSAESETSEYRVQFPLVYSETPGILHLTNEEIAEYLDDHEISR